MDDRVRALERELQRSGKEIRILEVDTLAELLVHITSLHVNLTQAPFGELQEMTPRGINRYSKALADAGASADLIQAILTGHSDQLDSMVDRLVVIRKQFDVLAENFDTRHSSGIVSLYAAVIGMMTGSCYEDWEDAAEKFVAKHASWHESQRWRFEPHPAFLDILLIRSESDSDADHSDSGS